jgi:hypothetical protein
VLRILQRVARFAPVGFPAFELGPERFDARAQGGKVLFACCTGARAGRARCGEEERGKDVKDRF